MLMILRKEAFGPLVPVLLQGELRFRGVGSAIQSLFSIQAAMGPHEFSFHYGGTEAPNEASGPNGFGCIWSQPIKQINEQLPWGLPALPLHTCGQRIGVSSSQKPWRPVWRRRWQGKKRPQGRHPVAFTTRWIFCKMRREGKEKRTSDILPPYSLHLGEATHIMGGTMKSLLDQSGLNIQLGTIFSRMGKPARCCLSFLLLWLRFFLQRPRQGKIQMGDKWSLSLGTIQSLATIAHTESVSLRPQDRIQIRKCKAVLSFKGMSIQSC